MAETSGLLNRRTGFTGTEGSNPSVSASGKPLSFYFNGLQAGAKLRPTARPTNGIRAFHPSLRGRSLPPLLAKPVGSTESEVAF